MWDETDVLLDEAAEYDESLRDEADDFEDALRAELVRAGLIEEW